MDRSSARVWFSRLLQFDSAMPLSMGTLAVAALDVALKLVNLLNGLRTYLQKKTPEPNDSGNAALPREVMVEQGGPDGEQDEPEIWHDAPDEAGGVEQDEADARADPAAVAKTLDVPACLLILYPKGPNAAVVCGGVAALPGNIIKGFDAVVGALKDKATIQDVPEIKQELGVVADACGRVLKDIKDAEESEDKSFPANTMKDVNKTDDSATELCVWAKRIASLKLDSSEAMTKQAKLQVVPYIVVVAYMSRIRVITRLIERDMASLESDKKKYLDRACGVVDDMIALLHKALERLMPNTSLLEIALDYQLPMAMYITLMTRFRAGVDAIKPPSARPEDIAAFDDGLSPIRDALHWKPSSGANEQAQGSSTIELNRIPESLWWAQFTDIDIKNASTNSLRTSIDIRELSHVLGAGSDGIARSLALKPGRKSALLQLPPASALRSTLCANIARARQAQAPPPPPPPPSFARISKPPPSAQTMRSVTAAVPPARLQAAANTPRTITGHTEAVFGVAVCPDGQRVVSAGSYDGTVRVWSLSTGQHLRTLSGHITCVTCVAVSPDGKRAVSGGWDKSVRIWSLDSGSIARHTLLQGHTDRVWAVAVSPDGRSIASGSADNTAKLWDVDTGQCRATLTGHSNTVLCVAFSPDGEMMVSGSNDTSIRVWSVRTRKLQRTLHAHADIVHGVAVTPDGQWLVSGSQDCTVKVWSLSSGAEAMAFTERNNPVFCVAVFPDGQRIAAGSKDGSVRVWNLRSKALELTLTGHSHWVDSVAVSPDGRSVVSGNSDTTIKVWALKGSG